MDYTFVYPNQLFAIHPAISKNRKIILIEDPLFFGDEIYPIKFHKKKLQLHYLSIQKYAQNKIREGYDVAIIQYSDLKRKNHTSWLVKKLKANSIHIVDVIDFELRLRIEKASRENHISIKWYDNPNFLLSQSDLDIDFKGKKRYLMANFYKKQRKRHNILLEDDGKPVGGTWSYDTENRKKLPKNIHIPNSIKHNYNDYDFLNSEDFVQKYFSENYGDTKGFNYPIDHNQAKQSLDYFLKEKFKLFGPYEDAISKRDSTLFHTVLTPYLNIGLITPMEVIDRVKCFAKEKRIPINSYEGLVRQIIGWREFIRGIYVVDGVKQRTKNFWNFHKDISPSFYDGSTGLEPVDQSIKKLVNNAYLNHIERLMILGNIFFLLKTHPDKVYKWFMELFIDAYDWVMVPNIYGMSQYSDGGLMSTKPYFSGSNYILKMSDYKKGEWCQVWDALYWNFINEHREFFQNNPRMSMMIKMYDKKPNDLKANYIQLERNIQF